MSTIGLKGSLDLDTGGWMGALASAEVSLTHFAHKASHSLHGVGEKGAEGIKEMGEKGKSIFEGLSETIADVAKALGIAGLLSAGAWVEGIHGVTEYAEALKIQSDRTGIAKDSLAILQRQFETTGIGAESATMFIKKMNLALSNENNKDLFSALGLDQETLLKMAPDKALNGILDKVRQIKGDKAFVAQQQTLGDIFGQRQGGQLMSVVADPESYEKAQQQLGSLPDVMEKSSEEMANVNANLFNGIPVKMRQLFAGFTDAMIPALTMLTEKITNMDFTPVGEHLGKALTNAYNLFKGLWDKGELFNVFMKMISVAIASLGQAAEGIALMMQGKLEQWLASHAPVGFNLVEGGKKGVGIAAGAVGTVLGTAFNGMNPTPTGLEAASIGLLKDSLNKPWNATGAQGEAGKITEEAGRTLFGNSGYNLTAQMGMILKQAEQSTGVGPIFGGKSVVQALTPSESRPAPTILPYVKEEQGIAGSKTVDQSKVYEALGLIASSSQQTAEATQILAERKKQRENAGEGME
jgi:hypothetical protein